jgi:hypothetical protein
VRDNKQLAIEKISKDELEKLRTEYKNAWIELDTNFAEKT